MPSSDHARRRQQKSLHGHQLRLEGLEKRYALNAAPILDSSIDLDELIANAAPPVEGSLVGSIPISDLIGDSQSVQNFSDADGDSPGLAIVDTNLQGGKLWYTLDNGQNWSDVGDVNPWKARVFRASENQRLYFEAGQETPESITDVITLKAWDQSNGMTAGDGLVNTVSTTTLGPVASLRILDDSLLTSQNSTLHPDGSFSDGSLFTMGNSTVQPSHDPNIIYICGSTSDTERVAVVDVTVPSSPEVLKIIDDGFYPKGWRGTDLIFTTDGYGYFTDGSQLKIINATDSRSPFLESTYAIPAYEPYIDDSSVRPRALALSPDNQYLYVTGGDEAHPDGRFRPSTAGAFSVIDISNRTNPQEVASLSEGFGYNEAMCLSADGKIAFITGSHLDYGTKIGRVDIGNPRAPVVIGWTEISDRTAGPLDFPYHSYSNASNLFLHKSGDYLLTDCSWIEVVGDDPDYINGTPYQTGDRGGGLLFDIRNGSFELASHVSASVADAIYIPSSDRIVNHWWSYAGRDGIKILDWQQPTSLVRQPEIITKNGLGSKIVALGTTHVAGWNNIIDKLEVFSLNATDTSDRDKLQTVVVSNGLTWASSANDQEFLFANPGNSKNFQRVVAEDGGTLTQLGQLDDYYGEYFLNTRMGFWYTLWFELSGDGTYAYVVGVGEDNYGRLNLTFQIGERISPSDSESFQHVSSVELTGYGGLTGGTYALTSNFAFDRIRNRFYTYYSGSLYGIDVNDPTNPILQTVDLLESPTNPLSGIVLSPDGTTLYVGRQDRHSLLTILTSSLFPPSGGEVGNPTPGPLPNPEGPISGTLNNFNAMPQVVSTDGRWLYGLREVRRIGVEFIQIVTLDLQSGTICDESELFEVGRVGNNVLTLNEVKDEIYLKSDSGIKVFTTANNPSKPEYVGGYGSSIWPSWQSITDFGGNGMDLVGVSSVTGNVYAVTGEKNVYDTYRGDVIVTGYEVTFSEFSRNNVPDSFSVDTVTVASSPPTVIPTLDDIGDLVIPEDAGLQQISISGISGSTSQPLQVTATSHNIGLIADPTVTYVSPDTAGSLAFTPVADRNGNATISVTVEAGGADHDLSTTEDNVSFSKTFSVTVTAVNDAASGSVVISGILAEDEVLTASNTLADVDGLGAISYQWKRNGMPIHGATGSTYTLVQEDVGAVMTVTANFTDNGGTAESVTSAATTEVTNVNDSPAGSVTITGTAREDEELTASHRLTDQDGLGVVSYQWNRDGVLIDGATESTYMLVQADVGAAMTVTASYTDGEGTAESVTSSPTTAVVNVSHSPTGSVTISGTAREDEVLTASHTLSDQDGLGVVSWQWNRDGVLIDEATDSTYTLVQTDVGAAMTVTANYTDGEGTPESVTSESTSVVENVSHVPTGAVTISGTAREDEVLTASHTLSDGDGLGAMGWQWSRDGVLIDGANGSTYTLVQADVGTAMTVTASYTDGEGTPESVTSESTSVVENVSHAPTGAVTISGTAREDEVLTASHTLSDGDGLGVMGWQWSRDGGAIDGANGSTYTLVQADVGTAITVTASYTDGEGTPESVTSSATALVLNQNDAPVGEVLVSLFVKGLVASSTLTDEDGLGEISWQWNRDGVAIVGAKGSTYTLTQDDVNVVITVTARYIDGEGTEERVVSSGVPGFTVISEYDTVILMKDASEKLYVNTQPVSYDGSHAHEYIEAFKAIGARLNGRSNELILEKRMSGALSVKRYRLVTDQSWRINGMFNLLHNESSPVLNLSGREVSSALNIAAVTGAYEINGVNNPTLVVRRGETYRFNLNTAGHPLFLQTTGAGYQSANIYTRFRANGQTSGEYQWLVSEDAPDEIFYQCKFHAVMFGKIIVVD